MNTCKTCKSWILGNAEHGQQIRVCQKAALPIDGNYCLATKDDTVIVGTNYAVYLATGPDFGCVKWEKK